MGTKKKKKEETRGRKRVGSPNSIVLTEEQAEWLRAKIEPGGTFAAAVRRVLQKAMEREQNEKEVSDAL